PRLRANRSEGHRRLSGRRGRGGNRRRRGKTGRRGGGEGGYRIDARRARDAGFRGSVEAMSENLLSVRGVKTYYGQIMALRGVDVDVNRGEIVTMIGANGAGKS